MTKPKVIICRDADELAHKAAEQFVALTGAAIARSERFSVALSGGSTPRTLYELLGSAEYRERIDWLRVHLFWGDERCVPPDHAESNFRMVRESLISKIQIPAENIHRMAGEKEPRTAAGDYEEELREFFAPARMPRFDLILLGLGEDGHTASLFPGAIALDETEHLVAAAFVERLNSHRLTLTLPVLNHAAQIFFLVSGEGKSAPLKGILNADPASAHLPAAKVQPVDGQLTWIVTEDAAVDLSG